MSVRKKRLVKTKFLKGAEAVEWMRNEVNLKREEAVKLGNQFIKLDLIQSLSKNVPFLDDPKAYYTFAVDFVSRF